MKETIMSSNIKSTSIIIYLTIGINPFTLDKITAYTNIETRIQLKN